MGVKNLSKAVASFKKFENSLEFMRNSSVAIDTSIFMYRYKYSAFINPGMFIERFKRDISIFKIFDITPIYVFDGIPPKLKQETHEKRKLAKERTKILSQDNKELEKNIINISKEDTQNVKNLFDSLDVKYFCPEKTEGEKYCAYLNKTGLADFVMSNDFDTLVFGCNKLVFTLANNCYNVYDTKEILNSLELTKEEFVDFCISCGTDYYQEGIPGLGPKKSMTLIKKHGLIETWNFILPEKLKDNLQEIRDIFLVDPEECNL